MRRKWRTETAEKDFWYLFMRRIIHGIHTEHLMRSCVFKRWCQNKKTRIMEFKQGKMILLYHLINTRTTSI